MNLFFFETKQLYTGFNKENCNKIANLQLQKGAFVALLGRNGAGKSTFIKTLARQILPLQGNFFIQNQSSSSFNAAQYSQILAIVNTEKIQADFLTGWDLLVLGLYPRLGFWATLSKHDILFIENIFEILAITELKTKLINECSDGEKQLLLLARALAQNTELLLLDEITAHLDFINREKVFKLLKKTAELNHKLIFLATHELNLAELYCDELLIFQQQNCFLGQIDNLIKS